MDDDQQSGFVRQRRNVFIGSCLVAFAEFADVTVSKINVVGTELQIKNPQTVNVVLWVVAIYWMWRYYQYYRTLDGKRGIWEVIWKRMESKSLVGTVVGQIKRTMPGMRDAKSGIKNPTITYEVHVMEVLEKGPLILGLPSWLKLAVTLDKTEISANTSQSVTTTFKRIGVNVDSLRLIGPYIRAFLYVTFHTAKVTDYLLPFGIFLIPVGYKVVETVRSIWQ